MKLFYLLSTFLSLTLCQVVEIGLVEDFTFTQCQCFDGVFTSTLDSGEEFLGTLTAVAENSACNTVSQSDFPISSGVIFNVEDSDTSQLFQSIDLDVSVFDTGFTLDFIVSGLDQPQTGVSLLNLFKVSSDGTDLYTSSVEASAGETLIARFDEDTFVSAGPELPAGDPFEIVVAFTTENTTYCIRSSCSTDFILNLEGLETVTIELFPGIVPLDSSDGLGDNIIDESIVVEEIRVYDRALSTAEMFQNIDTPFQREALPVALDILIETVEGNVPEYSPSENSFIDINGDFNAQLLNEITTVFLSEDVSATLNFDSDPIQLISRGQDEFTAVDGECNLGQGEFVSIATAAISNIGHECSQVVQVLSCILEVNDAPVVEAEFLNLEFESEILEGVLPFSFVPGFDPDDVSSSLNGEVPNGVLAGGQIIITPINDTQLFLFDNGCNDTALDADTAITLGNDLTVNLCVNASVGTAAFSYVLEDNLGLISEGEAEANIAFVLPPEEEVDVDSNSNAATVGIVIGVLLIFGGLIAIGVILRNRSLRKKSWILENVKKQQVETKEEAKDSV